MTLREATPLSTTLAEPMLAEGCRELLGRDQEVKDVLEGFDPKRKYKLSKSGYSLRRILGFLSILSKNISRLKEGALSRAV
jgi:hypothetical protein